METTKADSFNTELTDRTLWYDGDSTVGFETLTKYIMTGQDIDGLFVDILTPEIIQYNLNVFKKDKIGIKETTRPLMFNWDIPEEYKNIDIYNYISTKLLETCTNTSEISYREQRIIDEMKLYESLGLIDVLGTLIYIINTLIENNVVWGVGRGSSVSSYVLYLIGVHDIDSYKYGLNIGEFLRTE